MSPLNASNIQTVNWTYPLYAITRRWALHILPKGFTKSRRYGGFSPRHCQAYLKRCRELLPAPADAEEEPAGKAAEDPIDELQQKCPHCREPMVCTRDTRRRSWRELFRNYSTWGSIKGTGA